MRLSFVFCVVQGVWVCYTPLGCFSNDPPYSVPGYRAKLLPWSPEEVNPQFYLTTSEIHDEFLDWRNVTSQNFKLNKPVMVTVHGWTDHYYPDQDVETGKDGWIWQNLSRDRAKAFLDINYIALNWHDGAMPFYGQSVVNCQVAGRAITHMLNDLVQKYAFDPSMFHCAGHSLGGHVCAYAGKFSQSEYGWKFGRITGLDPAGPQFEKTDDLVHLVKTDAKFVDVIHTDAGNENRGFSGFEAPVGHADFYPNGGSQQTGCSAADHSCSHQRAPKFWIDSLSPTTDCSLNRCGIYDKPSSTCDGPCDDCNKMGYNAWKPTSPTVYSSTIQEATEPFCDNNTFLKKL